MKPGLFVLISASEEKSQVERDRIESCLLLGTPLLQLSLELALRLKPGGIFVDAGERNGELRASLPPAKRRFLSVGKLAEAPAGIMSLKSRLAEHKGKSLLVLDPRFPLLSLGTLRLLWRLHQRHQNKLTVIKAGRETPARICEINEFLGAIGDLGRRRKNIRLSDALERVDKRAERKEVFGPPRAGDLYPLKTAADLARVQRSLRDQKLSELQAGGVIILDPFSTWIDLKVRIGRDTVLYPSIVIEGNSSLGRGCRVYPFVHLIDTRVGHRVKILSSTMIERSTIRDDAQVGPFTHFRPNTFLHSRAKVGNFVELKNTVFGGRSKANHLSYIGDSIVEEGVNVGAGTITCNYDGVKKYQTVIEKGAFIGSGVELVAPVRVGRNSYVGAGSTITKDVSPEALAIARSRQIEKPGWARRRMKK